MDDSHDSAGERSNQGSNRQDSNKDKSFTCAKFLPHVDFINSSLSVYDMAQTSKRTVEASSEAAICLCHGDNKSTTNDKQSPSWSSIQVYTCLYL